MPEHNRAVFEQRNDSRNEPDDFPTPLWATRALMKSVFPQLGPLWNFYPQLQNRIAFDPCMGRGHMVQALREEFKSAYGMDTERYTPQRLITQIYGDYLQTEVLAMNWIIMNPPFKLAEGFLAKALAEASDGVAMFVRTNFLESQGRYEVFKQHRPNIIAQFAERVILHKGISRDPSRIYIHPITFQPVRPTTATSYCWMVWLKSAPNKMLWSPFYWIAPCREIMERSGDYDADKWTNYAKLSPDELRKALSWEKPLVTP